MWPVVSLSAHPPPLKTRHPGPPVLLLTSILFVELNTFGLYHPNLHTCFSRLVNEQSHLLESQQVWRLHKIEVLKEGNGYPKEMVKCDRREGEIEYEAILTFVCFVCQPIERQHELNRGAADAAAAMESTSRQGRSSGGGSGHLSSSESINNRSNNSSNINTVDTSSAFVALATTLHETQDRRHYGICQLNKALEEILAVQKMTQNYSMRKDVNVRFEALGISVTDQRSASDLLETEWSRLKGLREQLLMAHHKLKVQGLIAQMHCLSATSCSRSHSDDSNRHIDLD